MLKLFLWLRYLRKYRIVLLCISAVALSVALLIVVDSLFSGLIKGLKETVRLESGDVIIYSPLKTIEKYDVLLDKLEKTKDVKAASVLCAGGGLLWLENGDVREVAVKGLDIKRETGFSDWSKQLVRQNGKEGQLSFDVPDAPGANGAWLGINIIAEPNARTDEYDLQAVRERWLGKKVVLTTVGIGQKRRVIPLVISDIARTDTILGDQTVYIPYDDLFKIISGVETTGSANLIKVKLKDGADKEKAREAIAAVWVNFAQSDLGWSGDEPFSAQVIADGERDYFYELRKQMGVLLLIFSVVCSVAVLLVFCIFYMIVETKLKDIAIIKSCGASSTSAGMIFAGFGLCIGIIGAAAGTAIGQVIVANINSIERWINLIFGLKLWNRSSYILNYIPNQVNWPDVLPIAAAAIAGCCVGALIPAIVAARARPVEILRYE